ncbi:hypothetical protein SKAU_G00191610 [Synaphobranchus kaupii]|uniref:Uncharacterized protein n=1 Tax=Synaphobranchus kaupii TaxID=118154 RepID=A0A9Q1FDS3_SYNKA|nr:hypothetical protein SKAU_G00191610 [Synaphobranchus kaupii]
MCESGFPGRAICVEWEVRAWLCPLLGEQQPPNCRPTSGNPLQLQSTTGHKLTRAPEMEEKRASRLGNASSFLGIPKTNAMDWVTLTGTPQGDGGRL